MEREKVVISIDTDFFCRELPEWDFGHSEKSGLFATDIIWNTRYSYLPLHKEMNIKFADCTPKGLFERFKAVGLKIDKNTLIAAGWSHSFAYEVFRHFNFDWLYNFDAHHDCWDAGKEVDCANWVTKLGAYKRKQKPPSRLQYAWMFPKWLDTSLFGELPDEGIYPVSLPSFEKLDFLKNKEVVAIYIAQSPAWVAPHCDIIFHELVKEAQIATGKKAVDSDYSFVSRRGMTEVEARQALIMHKREMAKLKIKAMGEKIRNERAKNE